MAFRRKGGMRASGGRRLAPGRLPALERTAEEDSHGALPAALARVARARCRRRCGGRGAARSARRPRRAPSRPPAARRHVGPPRRLRLLLADAVPSLRTLDARQRERDRCARVGERRLHRVPAAAARAAPLPRAVAAREPDHGGARLHHSRGRRARPLRRRGVVHAEQPAGRADLLRAVRLPGRGRDDLRRRGDDAVDRRHRHRGLLGGGFYFESAPIVAPYHGVLIKDEALARVSAYRWHVEDAMPFARAIRVTIEHGSQNDYEGDYSSVAFFYQTEPHAPFPPFPSDPAQLLPLGAAGP